MNKKIIASLVVIAMLAVAIPILNIDDNSSDAETVSTYYGEFNVYVFLS